MSRLISMCFVCTSVDLMTLSVTAEFNSYSQMMMASYMEPVGRPSGNVRTKAVTCNLISQISFLPL